MNNEQLKEKLVELFQIISELCGYGLSQINNTKPVDEINDLMKPMEKYGLELYEREAVTRTNWDSYSQKLSELIYELRQRGLIK